MDTGLYPDRLPIYLLSKNFVRVVNRYGRNHEMLLLLLYYLRRNPLAMLRLWPMGIAMWKKGRISLWPEKIKGIETIRHMLEAAKALELPREKGPASYVEGTVGYRAVG